MNMPTTGAIGRALSLAALAPDFGPEPEIKPLLMKVDEERINWQALKDKRETLITTFQKKLKAGEIFPVEQGSYKSRLEELDHLLKSSQGLIGQRTKILQEGEGELAHVRKMRALWRQYPRLSFEPLSWRNKVHLPLLVPFRITSSEVTFVISTYHRSVSIRATVQINAQSTSTSSLHDRFMSCYQDLGRRSWSSDDDDLHLTCRFRGLIPEEVRVKIRKAEQSKMFDGLKSIFIIADPGELTEEDFCSVPRPIPNEDPLVVGYAPDVDPDALWLIAAFDTTPMEEAMLAWKSDAPT